MDVGAIGETGSAGQRRLAQWAAALGATTAVTPSDAPAAKAVPSASERTQRATETARLDREASLEQQRQQARAAEQAQRRLELALAAAVRRALAHARGAGASTSQAIEVAQVTEQRFLRGI